MWPKKNCGRPLNNGLPRILRENLCTGCGDVRRKGKSVSQSMPVEEIMGMEVSVFGFSMEVGMRVNEVHSE
jgi:hypothetical protein